MINSLESITDYRFFHPELVWTSAYKRSSYCLMKIQLKYYLKYLNGVVNLVFGQWQYQFHGLHRHMQILIGFDVGILLKHKLGHA